VWTHSLSLSKTQLQSAFHNEKKCDCDFRDE
jgi:hypothetical protein